MVTKNRRWKVIGLALVIGAIGWVIPRTGFSQLVGHWTFDGDLLDGVSGNHGTAIGDPQFDTDVPASLGGGMSLAFDGDDMVDIKMQIEKLEKGNYHPWKLRISKYITKKIFWVLAIGNDAKTHAKIDSPNENQCRAIK